MEFYVILGVDPEASAEDIRRAYRRQARRYHPDLNPGDAAAAERYARIVEAYETLAHPARRQQYDQTGQRESGTSGVHFEFRGFDFSAGGDPERGSTFSELFAGVLQQAAERRANEPEHGADLHCSVRLTLEEAIRGAEREVALTRLDACGACRGSGRQSTPPRPCDTCRGAGAVRGHRGHMVFARPCPACDGSGRSLHRACPACQGEAVHAVTERIRVVLPPGVADGQRLHVGGKGNAGRRGGRAGDLVVSVEFEPHPLFRREGDDLQMVLPVAVHEAMLGAKVDVPTLEEPCRLRIPPGTQSGQRLRLGGRGAVSARTGERGDLVIEVRVVVPRLVDERSKELIREFAALNATNVREHLGG